MVNEELWNEAQTYGDIQLVPFIDYYSLLTWKTINICIYGVRNALSLRMIATFFLSSNQSILLYTDKYCFSQLHTENR